MIDAIAEFFGIVIGYIYELVPNFGAAIIILTVLVKLVTFPLNNKQIESSRKMQKLQPEIKKIQQKYKDDKEKQNQAMSEFMRENKMNPLAGCLPLLVQLPILIGVFRLLREPDIVEKSIGEAFSPYLFQSAELVNLLNMPLTVFSVEAFFGQISYYYLFPIIAGATTFLYSKMSMPMESSQKMMLYMMPIMITVFSFSFPVGLVIYWTMNNIFSIGQHKLINYMGIMKGKKPEEPVKPEGEIKAASGEDELVKEVKNKKEEKEARKEKKKKEKVKSEADFFKVGSKKEESGSEQAEDELEDEKARKKKKKKGKGKK